MNLSLNRKFYLPFIFLWGVLLYLPSINVNFVNDEIAFIQRCKAETLTEFISLLDKKDFDGIYYRPAGNLVSGAAAYFFEYDHMPYRLFNAIVHALNGIVLFYFMRKLTGNCQLLHDLNKEKKFLIPAAAAVIFLSFPLNDYAVIWHTDLFDRLLVAFYLLSLIYFLKDSSPGFLSLLFFLLALLTKEASLSLPFMIILIQYLLLPKRRVMEILLNAFPYFLLAGIILLFRITAFNNNLFTAEGVHSLQDSFNIIKNFIAAAGLLIFPFFPREAQEVLRTHPFIIYASGLILFILFSLYFVNYRKKDKIFIFLIIFIGLTFLPASRLLMRWYLYLPSAGFAALIAYIVLSSHIKIRYSILVILLLIVFYSSYLLYRESKWVSVSSQGYSAVIEMRNNYSEEIAGAGEIYFATIPAKVDDIPLFHLAFDHHLKHFISSEKEYYVHSKSNLDHFTDTISVSQDDSSIYFIQQGSNNFISIDDKDIYNGLSVNGKIYRININNLEEPDRIYFTFSNGKFFLIKDKE